MGRIIVSGGDDMGAVVGRVPRGAVRPRLRKFTLLAAVGGLLLASCSSKAGTASLTLYSGQHQQTMALLVDAFTKASGIKVTVRHDNEATLANQIIQEGSRSPADVFIAENSPPLEALQARGLLAPVGASTLAAVASQYNSGKGDWVGVSSRADTFLYNIDQLTAAQLPSSILDLATPTWKGKVGYAPSETDFQPLVAAVVKLVGRDKAIAWLQGLKANGRVFEDNETLVAAVNKGDVAAAFMNTYYWYRLRDEVGTSAVHSAIHPFGDADAGNLINVSGAAVLASSAHGADAAKFLAFLVSAPGQQALAGSYSYEYPIGSGVSTTKVATPLDQLKPPPVTIADLGDGTDSLALLQQEGIL
ncbi:MAG: iron ABC transporter substrate-binding protein [Actinomycetota bacterium]